MLNKRKNSNMNGKQELVNNLAHRIYEKAIHDPKSQSLIQAKKRHEQK